MIGGQRKTGIAAGFPRHHYHLLVRGVLSKRPVRAAWLGNEKKKCLYGVFLLFQGLFLKWLFPLV